MSSVATNTRSSLEDALVMQFFSLGMQYYASARFAALSGLIPVSGNLTHHGVEMFLKGHLSRTLNEDQLRSIGHDLEKAWSAFKVEVKDPKLDAHDETVSEINAFEDIRYPQNIVTQGLTAVINPGKRILDQAAPVPAFNTPFYTLTIGAVDELMKDICVAASINPIFYTQSFPIAVRQALSEMNADSGFWVRT